ncbi:ATP-dependent zinc metalloprotease FtsH [Thermomonas sp.]|uniref:ATP-dependent zinc metalloprotease FtsH n=1 Tax=Thermomonas sp. TaxID=1971895 RepID=UPI001B56797E|nr:ATP-dependent zinc metalloprotease FtsH [Thermomonas sp.]MBK6416360.1 ATP-dependent zinc metalloprotease FtsH [Thermomonas sp.]MBK7205636.1 ATP-dependent zinc metalloprotease FtsH [Thermomonas sp.]MBL0227785.1 ATP-dependent zinc metalloprotease FtsH [Thermomonas sp.]MBP7157739.1 ATP-dependent zinc metalloprotease FtsH [Thermomonas sp.]MBP7788253.1 ATP-dependent zinc metalloprotease FtsH [Thermomonas sp.]
MNDLAKNLLLWVVVAVVLMVVFQSFSPKLAASQEVVYSQFVQEVQEDRIKKVDIASNERTVKFERGDGSTGTTTAPVRDQELISDLIAHKVEIKQAPPDTGVSFWSLVLNFLPVLLIIGFWLFMMRQMQQGGGKGAMSFGRSRAKLLNEDQTKVTFGDVAGCDEAKEEVSELVEFLRDPGRFQKLGGKIPRGVLMVGPPGTGKTLLARAIAGEAKVPFFSISGSDFVEMFVGVGASRVRDMFEQAKKHAPCIIFIDEIDAVGRHRGSGMGGGHDEREQTLNQMLVEMDGFEGGEGVIVIAATNRPDVLDKALLRPGRFDRQVMVGLPDIKGREQILKVHMRKVPLHDDVRADLLARGTPGFSGADLANLVNEAALFAARRNKGQVEMQDFEDAKDKIFMGPERRSMVMREDERRNTAFHESGHAVVAMSLPKADPVHKVTIMPRGWALGLTWQLPEHDQLSNYRDKMLEEISILFGGRIAEEIFVGQMSTGAANDFERATKLARAMVTKYGMSDALGTMVYADDKDSGFGLQNKTISEATQQKVDAEIRRILDEQYGVARRILEDRREAVEAMSAALLEWETIDAEQVRAIMEGRKPSPPAGWVEKTARPGKDEDGGPSTAQVVGGPAEQT